MAEDLGQFENKASDLAGFRRDPDHLERKSAAEHERRKRTQFDGTDRHSGAGGDVASSQRKAVSEGATRVTGNTQNNSD